MTSLSEDPIGFFGNNNGQSGAGRDASSQTGSDVMSSDEERRHDETGQRGRCVLSLQDWEVQVRQFAQTLAEQSEKLAEEKLRNASLEDTVEAMRDENQKLLAERERLQERLTEKEDEALQYLYHLDRINASPYWHLGMMVTNLVGAGAGFFVRLPARLTRMKTESARRRESNIRRREGRFNILYFSPYQSHPTNHGNRRTIYQFARYFQSKGHQVHFALLKLEKTTRKDVEDMRATWNTFDHLPCKNPMKVPTGSSVPFDNWYEQGLGEEIKELCELYDIDIVFCSYVFQSKLLDFVPDKILKIIDTHDKMGNRYDMLRANDQPLEFFSCTPEDEGRYLRRADIVVARREEEACYFNDVTGEHTAVVIPHIEPPKFLEKAAKKIDNVGIVASENLINLTIVRECLKAIERELDGKPCPFVVSVAGEVKKLAYRLPASESGIFMKPWVKLLGFVPDIESFYESMDIVLSPVTMGTGINVKTVQAMAYGMPLLTTRNGSKGIETGDPAHQHENLASLVRMLLSIIDQPAEIQRLAMLSRERYNTFYLEGLSSLDKIFRNPKLSASAASAVKAADIAI